MSLAAIKALLMCDPVSTYTSSSGSSDCSTLSTCTSDLRLITTTANQDLDQEQGTEEPGSRPPAPSYKQQESQGDQAAQEQEENAAQHASTLANGDSKLSGNGLSKLAHPGRQNGARIRYSVDELLELRNSLQTPPAVTLDCAPDFSVRHEELSSHAAPNFIRSAPPKLTSIADPCKHAKSFLSRYELANDTMHFVRPPAFYPNYAETWGPPQANLGRRAPVPLQYPAVHEQSPLTIHTPSPPVIQEDDVFKEHGQSTTSKEPSQVLTPPSSSGPQSSLLNAFDDPKGARSGKITHQKLDENACSGDTIESATPKGALLTSAEANQFGGLRPEKPATVRHVWKNSHNYSGASLPKQEQGPLSSNHTLGNNFEYVSSGNYILYEPNTNMAYYVVYNNQPSSPFYYYSPPNPNQPVSSYTHRPDNRYHYFHY